ncbi:uncharacterized protein P174DRAFT_446062 [Aspergillus novofumigatus IBT 16806]|uniref:Uncharacterized protein n=1 Tax=Aspergillus novofumigatus (strain IBT 16806) TaxID=1392255 RepID=A0A2I1BUB7_ASPN1|nr:uncharacterized protein P174DRAFT_446062 [Aspergillus novofumigatus IBT 16806]PKX88969.1 hypothetical protein P174DRAFT_446062 [Aspergillus novofumigatus IBT 16806]
MAAAAGVIGVARSLADGGRTEKKAEWSKKCSTADMQSNQCLSTVYRYQGTIGGDHNRRCYAENRKPASPASDSYVLCAQRTPSPWLLV